MSKLISRNSVSFSIDQTEKFHQQDSPTDERNLQIVEEPHIMLTTGAAMFLIKAFLSDRRSGWFSLQLVYSSQANRGLMNGR